MSIKISRFRGGARRCERGAGAAGSARSQRRLGRSDPRQGRKRRRLRDNQSPTADRLVSASTPVAKKAELHTMSMQGMVMKMRPISGLDIPAGQPVSLKPGGEHIMLMGLNQPLREGQSFPLTLDFEKAGPRTVTVTVEKAGAKGPAPAAAQH